MAVQESQHDDPRDPLNTTFVYEPLQIRLEGIHPGVVQILNRLHNPEISPHQFARIYKEHLVRNKGDFFAAEREAGLDIRSRTSKLQGCSLAQLCELFPRFLPIQSGDSFLVDSLAQAALRPWREQIHNAAKRYVEDAGVVSTDLLAVSLTLTLVAESKTNPPFKEPYRYLLGELCNQAHENRTVFNEDPRDIIVQRMSTFLRELPELRPLLKMLYQEWHSLIQLAELYRTQIFERQYPGKTPGEVAFEGFDFAKMFPEWLTGSKDELDFSDLHRDIAEQVQVLIEEDEWDEPLVAFTKTGRFQHASIELNLSELGSSKLWGVLSTTEFGETLVEHILEKLAHSGITEWIFLVNESHLLESLTALDQANLPFSAAGLTERLNDYVGENEDTISLGSYLGASKPVHSDAFEELQRWARSIISAKKNAAQTHSTRINSTLYLVNHPDLRGIARVLDSPVRHAFIHYYSQQPVFFSEPIKEIKLFRARECFDSSDGQLDNSIATAVAQIAQRLFLPTGTVIGFDYAKLRSAVFEVGGGEIAAHTEIFTCVKRREGAILFYTTRGSDDGDLNVDIEVPDTVPSSSI